MVWIQVILIETNTLRLKAKEIEGSDRAPNILITFLSYYLKDNISGLYIYSFYINVLLKFQIASLYSTAMTRILLFGIGWRQRRQPIPTTTLNI